MQGSGNRSSHDDDDLLIVPEVLTALRVSRSTLFYWRQIGKAPRAIKLPNGELRFRRSVLRAWLEAQESDAA